MLYPVDTKTRLVKDLSGFWEFSVDAMVGLHSEPPELFTEEYQNELVERQYRLIKSKPYTIGAHVWVSADFKTPQHHRRVVHNRKGIFTRTRNPKMVAHTLKELWKE